MIWLILALLASTSIMIGFKLYPRFNINSLQSISVNYLVAFFAGLITLSTKNQSPDIHSAWLPLSLISGIFLALTFFVRMRNFASEWLTPIAGTSRLAIRTFTSICCKSSNTRCVPICIGMRPLSSPTTVFYLSRCLFRFDTI